MIRMRANNGGIEEVKEDSDTLGERQRQTAKER